MLTDEKKVVVSCFPTVAGYYEFLYADDTFLFFNKAEFPRTYITKTLQNKRRANRM